MEWNASPILFSLGPIHLRWYGLLFATGFALAYWTLLSIFKKEKVPQKVLDELLFYVIVGTVVGARMGHCLFYEPARYLENPIEILFVWEGGLASHGGAIGIFSSVLLFSRKNGMPSFSWLVDRVCLTVPLAAGCVRLGNFFNSEIVGRATDLPWAIIFKRLDSIPRHPAMLYEAICYFIFFGFVRWLYSRTGAKTPGYLITGWVLVLIFSARFFIEFIKENQVDFEAGMALNMGQILSIPTVAIGLYAIWKAKHSRVKN